MQIVVNIFAGNGSETYASDHQERNPAQAAICCQRRSFHPCGAGGRGGHGPPFWFVGEGSEPPGLDARRDNKRGYSPEVIIGQLIYARCSGGGCLSDSEALNDDPLARELFGVDRFADQSPGGGMAAGADGGKRRRLEAVVARVGPVGVAAGGAGKASACRAAGSFL